MTDSNAFPSPFAEPERYEGRPLLLLIENWILDCIGELEADKQPQMQEAVSTAFHSEGPWRETFPDLLDLDVAIEKEFRQLWEEHRDQENSDGTLVTPVQFAKLIADENFVEFFEDDEA